MTKQCPDCGEPLKYDDDLDFYVCPGCDGEFDPEEVDAGDEVDVDPEEDEED